MYVRDSKMLLSLLKENDDVKCDYQVKTWFHFRQSLAGYIVEVSGRVINSDDILNVIHVINYLARKNIHNVSIHINFVEVEIADKLVYIILEDLCYYFICNSRCRLYVNFVKLKENILTDGIKYSPLCKLPDKNTFTKFYSQDISLHHYRIMIPNEAPTGSILSILNQNTKNFFLHNGLKEEYCDRLSEVIVEIVGNACEHGGSDCALDIDVTDCYLKKDNMEDDYYGVNVTVVNYSSCLFHQLLKEKINTSIHFGGRYELVARARENHQKRWKEDTYTENDFYMISSFQHKISGSMRKPMDVGGTGLTTLIRSLEDYSDSTRCYLLSGYRCLMFEANYLCYNADGLIGFNESNDYINDIPDKKLLAPCSVFFPGCAYNLHFVVKI